MLRVSGERILLVTLLGNTHRTAELTAEQARALSRGLIEAAAMVDAKAMGPAQGHA